VLVIAHYREAVVKLHRYRVRRAAARMAWWASVAIVAAVAAAFFAGALTHETAGVISDKRVTITPVCHDRGLTCQNQTCYQITYVTDSGDHSVACVGKTEYDKLQLGDRYAR